MNCSNNTAGPEKKWAQSGFTLIELLVVVVILGILVAFAAPELGGSIDDAKLGTLKKNLQTLRGQLQAYASDKGEYPTSLSDLTQGNRPYLPDIPTDPLTGNRNWQVAPPSINVADRNFYFDTGLQATVTPPAIEVSGTTPSLDTLGQPQNFNVIIDSSISDFLYYDVPAGNPTNTDVFGSNAVLKVKLQQKVNVDSVRIVFYSMPKIRYRIESLKVGTKIEKGWAVNDSFSMLLNKPEKTDEVEITFNVQKGGRATNEAIQVGVVSVKITERTGDLDTAEDATKIPGNKWYRYLEWETLSPANPGHAKFFGIGKARSDKTGFYSY
ncbi:MAG: hypothetical protein CVV64_08560 [Candidatus Wallbacteria bacterium HGW-Wallbacteria-1]|jgi:prepilin-type N-terminal cleavage/methylation domain-containing protein|uniref:Type II secretion system protein GspG C-terminal domain-containing protein n=1 Tax=Candidatus Wallbacteria bacterium HGW-Wallbacteria-1 TaxID=2013854 RepID=A0A2N1PPZ6_9BACT|nr:MAG: hypothetical protein CVV64_08560 [Candidatus Wallbacteria bacterium HGW-Wallbacteria-1]